MFTLGYTHALESLKVARITDLGFKATHPQYPTAIVEMLAHPMTSLSL